MRNMNLNSYVQSHKTIVKDDRALYKAARQVFLILFDYLRDQHRVPSAEQFNGLYLSLRWSGQILNKTKEQRWRESFPKHTVNSCAPYIIDDRSGIIGGYKGAITDNMHRLKDRSQLWRMMQSVAIAKLPQRADEIVISYAREPVSGLGRSIISSFLWALKPDWYPIVNGGNSDGLQKAIKGFPAANDLMDYVLWDVPCLRSFRDAFVFRDFVVIDRFFLQIPENMNFSEDSRFSYVPELDIQTKIREGDNVEQRIMTRRRSANARRMVLVLRGSACQVCDMSFKESYGVEYAEVHHVTPLGVSGVTKTDICKGLLVVCRNCHAMLHSREFCGKPWRRLRDAFFARRRKTRSRG